MDKFQGLKACGLSVGYPGKPAVLKDIDFELRPGAVTVLIGANGSGKSTLLRTLTGVQKALEGSVTLDGQSPQSIPSRRLARRMGVVYTDRVAGGGLTVRETVEIGRHPYTGLLGRLSDDDHALVERAMALVGISRKSESFLTELSDGERQKTMIARVLAQQTPLVILDEPTAFLDVAGRADVMRLLRRLADEGLTVLLSTHDVGCAMDVADDVWIVDTRRQTLLCGPRDEMIASGALERAFPDSGLYFDANVRDFKSKTDIKR